MPPTQNIRNLQLGAGDPGAWSFANRQNAGNVASSVPSDSYQKFNLALMDMLKQYQGLGTGKFLDAELQARGEQARSRMEESPAGFSPGQQEQMRTAEAGVFQPEISGAKEMRQTLSEQISSFGNVLAQSQNIGQWMEKAELDKKKELTEALFKVPDAFKSADPDLKASIEKSLGLPKGFIDLVPSMKEAPKTLETDQGIMQWDQKTGGWITTGFKKAKAEGLTDPQKTSTFNTIVDRYSKSPLIQSADKMKNYLNTIESAAKNPTPQKDLSLIYSFIKALDYGDSAVREGEITLGMNVGSIKQQLEAELQKVAGGGLMGASQRNNYISAARELIETVNSSALQKEKMFESQAQAAGIGDMWNDFMKSASTSYGKEQSITAPDGSVWTVNPDGSRTKTKEGQSQSQNLPRFQAPSMSGGFQTSTPSTL